MPDPLQQEAAGAEVVLGCRDLARCQEFFAGLGFRLVSIFPADAPRSVVMAGFGLRVALQRGDVDGGGHLRVPAAAAGERFAPNGARIEFVARSAPPSVAPAAFAIWRGGEAGFVPGRAGMLYQDLIPGRQGGAWIGSRIRIERGGPVPDYVHWHDVQMQVLHCLRGEVRVVYEDQGPPFAMRAGDTVLQPPGIRHRVLACSDGFEVLEVSSPAEHVTHVEHDLVLPTAVVRPERCFAGQRFVLHRAERAVWGAWRAPGWQGADTGIGAATGGTFAVRTVRGVSGAVATIAGSAGRTFWFVTRGTAALAGDEVHVLQQGSACVLPPQLRCELRATSADFAMLEVEAAT